MKKSINVIYYTVNVIYYIVIYCTTTVLARPAIDAVYSTQLNVYLPIIENI